MWTDPTTRESFIVDTNTGNSRRALCPEEGNESVPRRTLAARGQDDAGTYDIPPWIEEALTVCSRIPN